MIIRRKFLHFYDPSTKYGPLHATDATEADMPAAANSLCATKLVLTAVVAPAPELITPMSRQYVLGLQP